MFLRQHPLSQNVTTNSTETLEAKSLWCNGMKEGAITWVFFCSVNILFGFPACVAAMWEQFKRYRKGNPFTPNDIFLLNITVMDLIFFVSILADIVNFLLEYSSTLWYIVLCTITFSLSGRPLLMSCICVDCYLAVIYPLVYRAKKSLIPRVVAASIVWLVAVANGLLASFYQIYDNDKFVNSLLFGSVWVHLISLPTIAFCDFSILCALRRSGPGGRDLNPQKKRAHHIIVNSLIMTAIVYIPTVLIPLLSLLPLSEHEFMCQVSIPILILPCCGSTLMPILYLEHLGKLDHLKVWMMTCLKMKKEEGVVM